MGILDIEGDEKKADATAATVEPVEGFNLSTVEKLKLAVGVINTLAIIKARREADLTVTTLAPDTQVKP